MSRAPSMTPLAAHDTELAFMIMQRAFEYVATTPPVYVDSLRGAAPLDISASPYCHYTSDSSTRIAQHAGLYALRERHDDRNGLVHALTVFPEPGALPSEEDLIMCLTWRQFDGLREQPSPLEIAGKPVAGYFGPRHGIARLLEPGSGTYGRAYSAASVTDWQASYRRGLEGRNYGQWRRTTPRQLQVGSYPYGKINLVTSLKTFFSSYG